MTLEEALALIETQKSEIANGKARIKELSGEAGGHQSNAKAKTTELEKITAEFAALKTASEAAATAAKADLEKLTLESTAKLTLAEKAAADAQGAVKGKMTDLGLTAAAKEGGVADMDYLKLFDRSKLTTDEEGNPTNAKELLTAWKAEKPHFFGTPAAPGTKTGTTTNPAVPPKASNEPWNARTAPQAEVDAALAQMTGTRPNPYAFLAKGAAGAA